MNRVPEIRTKRVYEESAENDGLRVLVDRLWPRGLTKEAAKIEFWAKGLAPTTELRKWFNHQPSKFDEFRSRYLEELRSNPEVVKELRTKASDRIITLLYAARDRSFNHAVVLQEFLSRN